MKNRKLIKSMAFFVAMILTFLCVSTGMTVSPQEIAEDSVQFSDEETFSLDQNPTPLEPAALYEMEENRREFSTSFMQDDRSKLAIVTEEPMHYVDEQGNWQNIDNTLISATDSLGNEIIENKAGNMKVQLPKILNADETVNIIKDEYQISFKIEDAAGDSDCLVAESSQNEDMYEIDIVIFVLSRIDVQNT